MGERGNSVHYQNLGTIGLHYSADNKKKLFMKLDDTFLSRHNLDFNPPMGFLNKPFVPMLTTNLNISDLSNICGVDKADLTNCLKAIPAMIGQVLGDNQSVEVDLGELGRLSVNHGTVSFNPEFNS